MTELPAAWVQITLGDLCEFHAGAGFPVELQGRTGLQYPFYKVRDVSVAWSAGSRFLLETENTLSEREALSIKAKPVPTGAIAFAKIGEALRLNRRAITPCPSLIDNNLMAISASSDHVALEYLYFFTTITKFDFDARASVVPSIRKSDIEKLPFPLPPRKEQTRIVAKLEELLPDLDAGVKELKAAQRKLTQYRQALLKAALEGALTAEWRKHRKPKESGAQLLERILKERRGRWEERQRAKFKQQGKPAPKNWQKKYPEPVAPDATSLPELPKGWVWASVDQCSLDAEAITDGPFGSNLKSEHYQKSGPRVIRLQNIGDGVFINAYAHISETHFAKLSKHAVETGDVVVAMLGEILPRACAIPEGVAPAIVKADCARVRLNTNLVRSAIVVAQLNSRPIRDAVLKLVKGIGRPRINLGHIRALPIAVAPAEEQIAIETALNKADISIEDQLSAIDLSIKQSTAQRKNILEAAFTGILVPQDPRDEPASKLLERIRAERSERAKQPTARKTKRQKETASVVSKLIDVLTEAADWVPAQEAFRRCGVTDGALTQRIEELYAELRELDKAGRLAIQAVTDAKGRKLYDELKLRES